MLFVDDAGDDQATRLETAGFGDHASGANHGRHAALHVLRATAVDPAVTLGGLERPRHARDADGVDMAAVHQRTTGRPALESGDNIRPPRRGFLDFDGQAEGPKLVDQVARDRGLPRRSGHE